MDVFDLVRHSSSSWVEISRDLHIPVNERTILQKDPSINNAEKLQRVLAAWIYNETTDVKWSVILNVLEKLERKDLAKMVTKFLERPETYKNTFPRKTISLSPSSFIIMYVNNIFFGFTVLIK